MLDYRADSFSKLYATQLGQDLWEFLNRDETVARLVTTSEFGKPAVEGISDALLEKFGKAALEDRVKQMIGHMTRQVMEYHSWEMDMPQVRINGIPFTKGARYKHPNSFLFHAFRSSADPRDMVLTSSRQSLNLPADTHWMYQAKITSSLQACVAYGVSDFDIIKTAIREHGFYRLRVERILTARD